MWYMYIYSEEAIPSLLHEFDDYLLFPLWSTWVLLLRNTIAVQSRKSSLTISLLVSALSSVATLASNTVPDQTYEAV